MPQDTPSTGSLILLPVRKVGRMFRTAFEWIDCIEVAVGLVLAGALMLVVPLVLIGVLIASGRYAFAAAVGLGMIFTGWICLRDYRRGRLSWLSGILLLVWLLAGVFIGVGVSELVFESLTDIPTGKD